MKMLLKIDRSTQYYVTTNLNKISTIFSTFEHILYELRFLILHSKFARYFLQSKLRNTCSLKQQRDSSVLHLVYHHSTRYITLGVVKIP